MSQQQATYGDQQRYLKRVISYEPVNLSPGDLISLADAAKLLNVSLSTIRTMIARGELTEIKDQEPEHAAKHGRWLLRGEVQTEGQIRRAA
jgi:hypothetical protein